MNTATPHTFYLSPWAPTASQTWIADLVKVVVTAQEQHGDQTPVLVEFDGELIPGVRTRHAIAATGSLEADELTAALRRCR